MNDFDQRWQVLASKAGRMLDEKLPDLPLGFATRVLAHSREAPAESWEDLLGALSLRAVLVTTCLCLVSAGFAFSQWYEFRMERPTLERSMTSELPLPWP
ncbi:MAG: hypothetical protein ACOYOF_12530 [Verrucomicrobiaceae bacterium]|jgi:hypothetical protein